MSNAQAQQFRTGCKYVDTLDGFDVMEVVEGITKMPCLTIQFRVGARYVNTSDVDNVVEMNIDCISMVHRNIRAHGTTLQGILS